MKNERPDTQQASNPLDSVSAEWGAIVETVRRCPIAIGERVVIELLPDGDYELTVFDRTGEARSGAWAATKIVHRFLSE